jgi:probable rRNA maturation factor
MPGIRFFSEDIDFKIPHPRKTAQWLKAAIKKEKHELHILNYIFCSDQYLLTLNTEYLNHKTLTDIITFDNSEKSKVIEGDVFISVERVKENSLKYEKPFVNELHRVMIHGVLHLLGYSDKTRRQKSLMRRKEDTYLTLLY